MSFPAAAQDNVRVVEMQRSKAQTGPKGRVSFEVQLAEPSTIQWVQISAPKSSDQDLNIVSRSGRHDVRLQASASNAAAKDNVLETVDVISVPAGRYEFVAPSGARTAKLGLVPWATPGAQVETVKPSDAASYALLQRTFRYGPTIAAATKKHYRNTANVRKPGTFVTSDLQTAGVLPRDLVERGQPSESNNNVAFAAFFAGDTKTTWLQLKGLPPAVCKSAVRFLVDGEGDARKTYSYAYANAHDGYANIMASPVAPSDRDGYASSRCELSANTVTMGIPLDQ